MTSVFSKYLLGQKKLEIGLCIGFSCSLLAFMFAKSNYYDLFYNEKKMLLITNDIRVLNIVDVYISTLSKFIISTYPN